MNRRVLALSALVGLISSCATPRRTPARAHDSGPDRVTGAESISGVWQLTVFARGGSFREMLYLAQVGTIITGHTESGTISTLNGAFNPPSISWQTGVDASGVVQPKEIPTNYRGVVNGDSMEGIADLGVFGEAAWTAVRVKP